MHGGIVKVIKPVGLSNLTGLIKLLVIEILCGENLSMQGLAICLDGTCEKKYHLNIDA